ncbi:MAG: cellobiose phosphorylase [Candidatus Rokubacteria bacterium]|nr:cellobiose phosphorylase [Candidatus Rokubacteria bacterium]
MATGGPRLADRLHGAQDTLDAAHRRLAGGGPGADRPAAEWLLDNYYVVERACPLGREEFPPEFEHRLHRTAAGELSGLPAVYALAREIVTASAHHVEVEAIARLVAEFQTARPLSVAEVWALPLMLRIVLVESLAEAVAIALPDEDPTAETSADRRVAACIRSLRTLETTDWKAFFEEVSETERILREDPAGVYARMDFDTRDRCRKVVEELAERSDRSEDAVAREAVRRSRESGGRGGHVGFHLIDDGFEALALTVGYRPAWRTRWRRLVLRHPTSCYLGAIAAVALLHLAALGTALVNAGVTSAVVVAGLALAVVPAATIAVSVVNRLTTHLMPVRVLPKMDFRDGIPADCRTMIAVQVLVAPDDDVSPLLSRLEIHWLASADPNVHLALLVTLADAPEEAMPGDVEVLGRLEEGIRALNAKYGQGAHGPFHLLHRRRRWNAVAGCWMGWERKRGQVAEFNRLLAGDPDASFAGHVGDPSFLYATRFVITLDADTELPRGAARRLVETFAHPLNRAEFDPRTNRVTAGYTILQPRMEVTPFGAPTTSFSRLFAGDPGVDLYARAASDVYQDLFGEGIYVGKGIYEPAAFERSLRGRVPENAVLSHDLFEGIHGRAALVTDVALFEHYPTDYRSYWRRLHRWARGDWQLLPWLGRRVPLADGERAPNRLPLISRWKIADNLRRTLLPPTLLGFLLLAWTTFPGAPAVWSVLAVLVLAAPVLTETMGGLLSAHRVSALPPAVRGVTLRLRPALALWILHVAFLPHRAIVLGDAIVRTLARLRSGHRLLEWTSAARMERAVARTSARRSLWREMAAAPVAALGTVVLLAAWRPEAVLAALPLATLWLLAPGIAGAISRPRPAHALVLPEREARRLRLLARRTWLFFDTFVGPDDQWLPPDHLQEEPRGEVARRTSPTNIGLLGLATLAAHDLGHAGLLSVVLRLRSTLETLERMERHRGHFYNWYDTRDLAPLLPRYVSTVDSGNLAACLLAVKQGCLELVQAPVIGPARWQGLIDTLDVLLEVIARHARRRDAAPFGALRACIERMREEAIELKGRRSAWGPGIARLLDRGGTELDQALLSVIAEAEALDPDLIAELRVWSAEVPQHLEAMWRDLELCLPWEAPDAGPPIEAGAEIRAAFERSMPSDPTLAELPSVCESVSAELSRLEKQLDVLPADDQVEIRTWARRLQGAIARAEDTARTMLSSLEALARRAEALVETMDFAFLYDERRRLFHIGHDVTADRRDPHHYDLLASEARLASFVAIAKGDVPEEHWRHLARPLSRVNGAVTLLSWSGTMFEYLMPRLLLGEAPESLVGRACAAAVETQIAYAVRRAVPWGISESGYYRFDAHRNYQYRAFGVPDLGFKRGLEEDLVVAPYASLLALPFAPSEVIANLARLDGLGLVGRYGLYEAVDFTTSRLEAGRPHAIVRSFMAHHQGMILTAIDNVLHGEPMVRRFHADPIVRTTEALLFERPATVTPAKRRRPTLETPGAAPARRPGLPPWPARPGAGLPQAHVLSNGRYRVLVSDGGDGSDWSGVALTRWRADGTLDGPGFWLYVRDLDRRRAWSLPPGDGEMVFHAHMVERHHRVEDVVLREQVCVAPTDDVEVRLLTVRNATASPRRLALTSYAEVVAGAAAEDQRHPAFSKLFVECEYVEGLHALVFHRRSRSDREPGVWLAHMLVLPAGRGRPAGYESSRERFVGRGRTPRWPSASDRVRSDPGMTGATLDPIMSLSAEIELPGHAATTLAYVIVVARAREDVLTLLRRYRSLPTLEWTCEAARQRSEAEVADLGLAPADLPDAATLLSLLLYPHDGLRAPAAVLARNRLGQRSLWKHAISGDLPVLVVRIGSVEDTAVLPSVLRAHRFWRGRGIGADVVILNERAEGYVAETDDHVDRAITQAGAEAWRDRPGGVFVIRSARIDEADRILLLSVARVVLDGSGSIRQQLARLSGESARLPRLVPSLTEPPAPESLPRPASLQFDNGIGGFSADGREYVIHLEPGESTPAPWVNVVANRRLGFVVSESGGGYTWAENSGENRLTPWRNDPVSDEPGEVLYLRDEETGAVWTPTPLPAPADRAYQVRYGAGYAIFHHLSHGLEQSLRLWVPIDDPVKLVELTLSNRLDRLRRVTVTYYVEWVLGATRDRAQAFVVPEFDPASEALLARNPWNEDFGDRVAFVAASQKLHGLTADRAEFLGRHGSYAAPAAMGRIGLASAVRPGLDPCAALQVHLDIAPGATANVHFALGQAFGRDEALGLVTKYRDRATIDAAWDDLHRRWDALLGAVTVRTPDPALDLMLNRWLLYQVLSSRLWGRTGYYQSSGAFGFRDQLQDVAALVHGAPTLCRDHILEAARHQFEAGDVLHWWHPPAGAGVRTRCSDDLLWLPFVTAHYVETTGDTTILSEEVPYLLGEPLEPREVERYARFEPGERRATLYRHCLVAIERGRTAGAHGLPLFGSGDWNDGMNRVGIGGRGESVWLAWFLYATLTRFAPVAECMGDTDHAQTMRRQAENLRAALEATAWDGAWYRRGYYDDGRPLGSAERAECRIDSLAQSWAVLSGASARPRAAQAMEAVARHLVRTQEGLILLLTPPFDSPDQDPGYLRGYPPGIRENGGQYTHAAIWVLWALLTLGDVEHAVGLFQRLLPIRHALTLHAATRYRTEPYVLASDVYSTPPWTGRGGWTWYTGAAAWAYRLGVETILGVRRSGGTWRVDPHVPANWAGFEVVLRDGTTIFHVSVENPRGVNSGVERMLLDGAPIDPPLLPRLTDGRTHEVRVTLGRAA